MSPHPATELVLPEVRGIDTWASDRILAALLGGQRRALDAVESALPQIAKAAALIVPRLKAGGRLVYAGAGTSIRVAVQDGTELPATFGFPDAQLAFLIAGGREAMFETRADAEDDAMQGAAEGGACSDRDVLIAVAASGRTPYTVAAARAAKAKGCLVVAVVNNGGSHLADVADLEILLPSGAEVISGSTRMGAGTAQKAALNLLSTLINIRLGAVHDGLMVNLHAGNSKLADRATRIVSGISGVPLAQAATALETAQGSVKLAVVLCSGASNLGHAQDILTSAEGQLRTALAKLNS